MTEHARAAAATRRLTSVPSFDVIGATARAAAVGDGEAFRRARDMPARLGLVPKQMTNGGRPRLLGITKRGNTYLRTLLIHGARAALPSLSRQATPLGFLHGHHNTTTLVASLRKTGMVAPMTLDGPIIAHWFEAYVRYALTPALRPGDVVDNHSSHKRASVRDRIEAAGVRLLFLRPYSPDFNPIEMAFAKFKALLRKTAERTVESLWNATGAHSTLPACRSAHCICRRWLG